MTRDDEGELMSKMPLKTRKARGVVVFAGEHEEADRTSFWKREVGDGAVGSGRRRRTGRASARRKSFEDVRVG